MDLRIFDFEIYLTFLITFIIISLFDGKSKICFWRRNWRLWTFFNFLVLLCRHVTFHASLNHRWHLADIDGISQTSPFRQHRRHLAGNMHDRIPFRWPQGLINSHMDEYKLTTLLVKSILSVILNDPTEICGGIFTGINSYPQGYLHHCSSLPKQNRNHRLGTGKLLIPVTCSRTNS